MKDEPQYIFIRDDIVREVIKQLRDLRSFYVIFAIIVAFSIGYSILGPILDEVL